MKNGIPCNETRFTPKAGRDRITYQFVSDDGITPASCTVKLGDTDPLTGEKLTDLEFFRAYYRQVDKEIHSTLDCLRPDYTEKQEAWRKEEASRYAAGFRKKYGYAPSRDDILWYLEQKEKQRYCLYYDGLVNEDGESLTDCIPDFGRRDEDPFGADQPDDIYALRELAATLRGRKKDVYEAMLHNLSGSCRRITNVELARRWGVYENCIRQDQAQIRKMIREKLKKQFHRLCETDPFFCLQGSEAKPEASFRAGEGDPHVPYMGVMFLLPKNSRKQRMKKP